MKTTLVTNAMRLQSLLPPRVGIAALIWATGLGIPAKSWSDAAILDQQILNDRQQQDLLREQRSHQQRSQNATPADQPRLKQQLRQQRLHQQQLQRRQLQGAQHLQFQGRSDTGINRPRSKSAADLQRSRRVQESQRLQLKLQRRTWRNR